MISIFIGENTVERDEAVSSYLSSFKNAHGELSIFKIDAESDSKNDFLDAILSVPFFSDKKLVKVVGLEKNKENLELLLSQQNNIPSNCEVMVVSSGFDGRLKTAQELLKISTVRENSIRYDRRQLERWLNNYFHQEGASITQVRCKLS
jgi:DNA polymerase III delta subunit